jgi:TonB family protein
VLLAASVCRSQEANPAPAQADASGGAYRIGNGISPPGIVYKVEPEYSEEARKMHFQGTVKLSVVVDTEGNPRDIKVIQPLGLGLDRKAIDAVSKWRFSPGRKDGRPVPVQARIEVNFRLLNKDHKSYWHLANVMFHLAAGVEGPVIEKVTPPRVKDHADASATLSLTVNIKGEPAEIRVDKASDAGWANDVTDALRKWRFSPGTKDGQPVPVPVTLEFVRAE